MFYFGRCTTLITGVLLIALTFTGIVPAQPTERDKQQMQQQMSEMMRQMEMVTPGMYSNDEYHYRIDVPEGWTAISMGLMLMAFEGKPDMAAMAGGYPDTPSFMVMVDTTDASKRKPLAEWNSEEMKAMVEQRGQKENVDVTVTHSGKTSLQGQHAFQVTADLDAGSTRIQQRMYITEHRGNAITLMYIAPKQKWDGYADIVDEHIHTLDFMD